MSVCSVSCCPTGFLVGFSRPGFHPTGCVTSGPAQVSQESLQWSLKLTARTLIRSLSLWM